MVHAISIRQLLRPRSTETFESICRQHAMSHPLENLLFPALDEFPPGAKDLAAVRDDVTALRLVEDAAGFDNLSRLARLKKLWCFKIDEAKLREIAQCVSLRHLFLGGLRVADCTSLARLRMLESLSLETAHKVRNLDPLGELDQLTALGVLHFKSVRSLAPLRTLKRLRALAVAGSMWTRMTVESLSPLSELKELRLLHLTNRKPQDESLEALHELKSLEKLECGNFYPMEQFARLRAALPRTRCHWFSPAESMPIGECKKCGQASLVMLSGKGTRTACRSCDAVRIRRHEDAFNAIAGGGDSQTR